MSSALHWPKLLFVYVNILHMYHLTAGGQLAKITIIHVGDYYKGYLSVSYWIDMYVKRVFAFSSHLQICCFTSLIIKVHISH